MYEYVVVAPPSYEHAHTSTSVWRKQSLNPARSASKHTVPAIGSSPTAGWLVDSHPVFCVPHARSPGGDDAIRDPAAPSKTYQPASSTVCASAIGDG